jgi:signal transduction histidine kinase
LRTAAGTTMLAQAQTLESAEPMRTPAKAQEKVPRSPEEQAYFEAQEAANRKIKFVRHAVIYAVSILFFLTTAGFEPAMIIGLIWGVFLAQQGFSSYFAPQLRRKWIDEEVRARLGRTVTDERRAIEGRHARSLEELSASIAHEIRNPITAAKSLVQQMGEDPANLDNVEYAKVALGELDRVEKSISHLLRFAREEDLQLSEVHLPEVLDSALDTCRDRITRLGVEVTRELDSECLFQGDAEKVRRVVINLVSNALDAVEESKTASPKIEISAGENLARTDVWLRIKDNGPGIQQDKLKKIWNPFYTSKSTGTGLGLAISKKLVDAHGGTIDARSELGLGAEFVVTFPKVGEGATTRRSIPAFSTAERES